MSSVLKPIQWIFVALSGFVSIVINVYILYVELHKRMNDTEDNIKYPTKYMKLCPILSLICGVMVGLFTFIGYFPILCNISGIAFAYVITSQSASVRFYQLSRLYYCCAQTNIHSKNGYPDCIYYIMYTIGALILINTIIYPWLSDNIFMKCGINKNYEYFPYENTWKSSEINAIWINITAIVLTIWDFTTLSRF